MVPWAICAVLAVLCVILAYRTATSGALASTAVSAAAEPWPFSQLFDARHQTLIVVADSNYGMSRILASQSGSLDQYLRRDFQRNASASKDGPADSRLSEYISNSTLTSFADVADVVFALQNGWTIAIASFRALPAKSAHARSRSQQLHLYWKPCFQSLGSIAAGQAEFSRE
jgi:hypothetical protein